MDNSHYWHLDFLCLEQYAHTEIFRPVRVDMTEF